MNVTIVAVVDGSNPPKAVNIVATPEGYLKVASAP